MSETPAGEHSADCDRIDTDVTEWAVQCNTRTGEVFTGSPKTSRNAAQESGERLEKINGAQWWLITRRRFVTVETTPWTRVIASAETAEGSGDE